MRARCLGCTFIAQCALFQLPAFAVLEWASSQDGLCRLSAPGLQYTSSDQDILRRLYVQYRQYAFTAQCVLCQCPALALRCVSSARCHLYWSLCNGFDLRLLFIGVPGRLCLPEKTLVSPFGLGGNESHLVRQVYTNTKDLCKSQDGNKLFINP